MKRIVFCFLLLSLFLSSCNSVSSDFLITENQVGVLKKDTQVSEIQELYKGDFSVKNSDETSFEVYQKEELILKLTPNASKEKIYTIEIFSPDFTTNHGISLKTTFAELQKKYESFDVSVTFKSLLLCPQNSNLCFIFDKSSLMASKTGNYTINDIPEAATPKQISVFWFEK